MTTELSVRHGGGGYPVIVGQGLLAASGRLLRDMGVQSGTSALIVSDDHVVNCGYPATLADSCLQAGLRTTIVRVPPGDSSKSLATVQRLYDDMLHSELRRDSVVIAVGGGMVGDLAGFAAASYLRGVRFVQVPTTLLAHDSSLGGKVGVNLPQGKNLVGAFHPPLAVLYDTDALATLPDAEWRSGMAEVIKEAWIGDANLFTDLCCRPIPAFPGADLAESIIARAAAVKISIIEADEHERSRRMWLNLGHTVGHAVEQVSAYAWQHGEAISVGMVVEAEIAVGRNLLSEEDRDLISSVLRQHNLPTTPPDFPLDDVLESIRFDKKHRSDDWTFVLPVAIGQVAIVHGVMPTEVMVAWQRCKQR